jgi:hypothetical protein
MTALSVVEDLDVLEHGDGQFNTSAPALAVEELDLHSTQKDSMTALSNQSPTEPIAGEEARVDRPPGERP